MEYMRTFIIFIQFLLIGTQTVFASAEYVPITKGLGDGGAIDMNTFVNWVITYSISLGGALAVLMIVIGGFQMVLYAGQPSAKSAAKEKLFNAIFGFGLLLLSYLILKSINPNLVSFSF